jgi:hypothetical protein
VTRPADAIANEVYLLNSHIIDCVLSMSTGCMILFGKYSLFSAIGNTIHSSLQSDS